MTTAPRIDPADRPVPAWARPVPPALPTVPRAYHHFLRTERTGGWRGLLAIGCLLVGFLIVTTVLAAAAVGIDIATGRTSFEAISSGQLMFTPMLFLANNLALAGLIPLSMLLQWAFYGVRPRWASSVLGGLRWRWMGRAALIVVPVFALYAVLSYVVVPQPGVDFGRLGRDAVLMLAIVVITTPFQAAGEEYGFRGLITRAVGSWFAGPVAALVVGTVLANVAFMIAHLATDPWLIAYYFLFGSVLGLIVWRTGGLEVSILIHVANNLFLLIPVALYGDISQAFNRGPGSGGPILLVPMALLLAVAAVIEWWARRNRIARLSTPEPAADPVAPPASVTIEA